MITLISNLVKIKRPLSGRRVFFHPPVCARGEKTGFVSNSPFASGQFLPGGAVYAYFAKTPLIRDVRRFQNLTYVSKVFLHLCVFLCENPPSDCLLQIH